MAPPSRWWSLTEDFIMPINGPRRYLTRPVKISGQEPLSQMDELPRASLANWQPQSTAKMYQEGGGQKEERGGRKSWNLLEEEGKEEEEQQQEQEQQQQQQ